MCGQTLHRLANILPSGPAAKRRRRKKWLIVKWLAQTMPASVDPEMGPKQNGAHEILMGAVTI
jgi:hypothetical protein